MKAEPAGESVDISQAPGNGPAASGPRSSGCGPLYDGPTAGGMRDKRLRRPIYAWTGFGHGVRAHQDDRDRWGVRGQGGGQPDAIQSRHPHIGENQVWHLPAIWRKAMRPSLACSIA